MRFELECDFDLRFPVTVFQFNPKPVCFWCLYHPRHILIACPSSELISKEVTYLKACFLRFFKKDFEFETLHIQRVFFDLFFS